MTQRDGYPVVPVAQGDPRAYELFRLGDPKNEGTLRALAAAGLRQKGLSEEAVEQKAAKAASELIGTMYPQFDDQGNMVKPPTSLGVKDSQPR